MVGDLLSPHQFALAVIEFRLHGQLHLLLWLTGKEHIALFNDILKLLSRIIDQANALHLGGDETSNVDPDKECYPAGQGVGAMHELIPAGDLVRQIVDEAEHALARAAKTVVG